MKQSKRKEILFGIDKNKKYSNEELFLADLTPYYAFENNESTFFEKILEYKNDLNRMLYNPKISFTPEQRRIFKEICSTENKFAISATTSFGKTTIIKEYIKRFQPSTVVYIVPTNSLADELLDEFEKIYKPDEYEVIDTSIKEMEYPKIIFIGTQEKLKEIPWLTKREIDLFVIDEAYKLTDEIEGFREIILNRIFVDYMNSAKKFILLLPLVNNIIGLENFGFNILTTDYAPVEKDYIGIKSSEYDDLIVSKIQENEDKNLVYFSSPGSLENFFKNELMNKKSIVEDEWIKRVEKDFHSEWFPVIAYKMGLSIHYGPMPKFFQIKMVNNFNKNEKFNTILSTSSLIEGVNTPTKNIFIKDGNIFNPENRIKYKNLIGRAGRLGITPIGNIYYDNDLQLKFEEANEDWNNINIRIIIDNNETLEKINRDQKNESLKIFSNDFDLNIEDVNIIVEENNISIDELKILINNLYIFTEECEKSYYPSSVPGLLYLYNRCYYKNRKNINNYNIRLKSRKELLELMNLSEKSKDIQEKEIKKVHYNFLGTLLSATMNEKIYNKNMNSISNMLDYISKKNDLNLFDTNNSEIISCIIGMMYSGLPYDIIPFLELIIATNNMFIKNNKSLISEKLTTYINDMIKKYNLRYFGKIDCTDKERKIIKRCFEYGIPYGEIKEHMSYLVENIPDSFSINHIKETIEKNEELNERLNKYFY